MTEKINLLAKYGYPRHYKRKIETVGLGLSAVKLGASVSFNSTTSLLPTTSHQNAVIDRYTVIEVTHGIDGGILLDRPLESPVATNAHIIFHDVVELQNPCIEFGPPSRVYGAMTDLLFVRRSQTTKVVSQMVIRFEGELTPQQANQWAQNEFTLPTGFHLKTMFHTRGYLDAYHESSYVGIHDKPE